MESSVNAKQQIVERVKQSTNILVTVNSNPSVDALSAALAFTLMLNKLEKHVSAVFSGSIPPAIKFLEPGKTFENDVNGLRDFIIALDKDKADRLRYKVENDVVKIFITPYRTSINEKDLRFSQGDFNVDLIVALGVERREELDKAIVAHGRILHDAGVMTINAGNQKSSIGVVDWQDPSASSLCEMLLALAEALQPGLLDPQLSTALLTGIVAATERFSNQHTTPRVMTMAAQLMAAGANQQLIAANLRTVSAMMSTGLAIESAGPRNSEPRAKSGANGEMLIKHTEGRPDQPAREPRLPIAPPPAAQFNDLKQALQAATDQQQQQPRKQGRGQQQGQKGQYQQNQPKQQNYVGDKPSWMGRTIQPPSMGGTLNATAAEALEDRRRQEEDDRNRTVLTHGDASAERTIEPLSSAEPASRPEAKQDNEPINVVPEQPAQEAQPPQGEALQQAPEEPAPQPAGQQEPAQPQPEAEQPQPAPAEPSVATEEPAPQAPAEPELVKNEPTIEELERQAKQQTPGQPLDHEEELSAAREAVNDALEATPEQPSVDHDQAMGVQDVPAIAPPLPPSLPPVELPQMEQNSQQPFPPMAAPQPYEPANQQPMPPLEPLPPPEPSLQSAPMNQQPQPNEPQSPQQAAGLPLPPLPDFSTLPPLPPQPPQPQLPPLPEMPPANYPNQPGQPPAPSDPGQFRIPGA
jgi:hypothetical protein